MAVKRRICARTYGAYLARLDHHSANKGSILEIGCGNGFFLKKAREQGWREVRGVEPSRAAETGATGDSSRHNMCDDAIGLFPADSFDAICLFQVLDHVLDPNSLLKECFKILKPNGLILCLNHNVEALSAKLMKERSPIVDIEHPYLYSPTTIKRLVQRFGFKVREAGGVMNRYSISYLMRLIPMPAGMKERILAVVEGTALGRVPLRIPLGNLYMIAQKPG